MVGPAGLESTTTWFEVNYSIQLSYRRVFWMWMAVQYKRKFQILTFSPKTRHQTIIARELAIPTKFGIRLRARVG